jgi:hypothetical protein
VFIVSRSCGSLPQRLLTEHLDDGMLNGSPTSTDCTLRQLKKYDVVLTTYNTIRLQHVAMCDTEKEIAIWLKNQHWERQYRPKSRKTTLYLIEWCVILDDANTVSHPDSVLSTASCRFKTEYRILPTGTPLRNEFENYHGLLKLMRVQPWANDSIFAKVCDLQWVFTDRAS